MFAQTFAKTHEIEGFWMSMSFVELHKPLNNYLQATATSAVISVIFVVALCSLVVYN